ncbi:protein-disulfide reductase DsbD family protein [Sphingobium sp. UBA5915]|uniref:protein-disulfide reductase DsbD family protein n=1 Tax=Sphingobium sp. UBA5915 TaxID=1947530 RepID=UPI0025D8B355|nr:thioredoxin family protein [Sphingobium sp. UBA5915]
MKASAKTMMGRLPGLATRLFSLFVAALLSLVPGPLAAQGTANIDASLLAESSSPKPGTTTRIAIRMVPRTGWHGYWVNPGDSGLSVEANWTVPDGVTIGELRHPAPALLKLAGLASYVHKGAFTLLTDLTLDGDIAPGTAIPLRANLSWLACSDKMCVPERATLDLRLTAGDGINNAAAAPVFQAAEAALPVEGRLKLLVGRQGGDWRFDIDGESNLDASSVRLFPAQDGWFAASAPQNVTHRGNGWRVTVAASDNDAPTPSDFRGVFTDGKRSFALMASGARDPLRAEVPVEQSAPASAAVDLPAAAEKAAPAQGSTHAASADTRAFRVALAGAILGGLLLNLMPCVFPVLSLKALSLARSGADRHTAKVEGLAYFAGSVATTTALGAILVGARAMGHDIGWSFQLQDPRMILLLMLLSLAIALNLAGLFEVSAPSLSGNWLTKKGGLGAFGTGALAALSATPCSGPFMGVALGAALVLPVPAALVVFAGLGLGMALPFLLIAFVPRLQRWLPKPGAWMETFRRILAIPMLLTAIGLAWVLGRQSGVDGLAMGLLIAALAGVGLWWVGLRQSGGRPATVGLAPVIAALLFAVAVELPRPTAATASVDTGPQVFSEARFAELRAHGVPVFVDFTADWCLVCQVNEQVAIDRADTQAAFAKAGVTMLVADWTQGDPAITRFLASRGRNSIPYYLFAPPKSPVRELPQMLSSEMLIRLANESEENT